MSFSHFFILIFIVYLGVRGQNGPQPGIDYPDIACGKKNPKKEKDCTKYGTDSGMLCCWVANNKDDTNGKCTLFSQKTAEDEFNLKDKKQLGNKYWSCGNKSFYLRTDIFLILILLVLTLLY
jgi:hypothetical protein